MMRLICIRFLLFLLVLFPYFLHGQPSQTIHGVVKDSTSGTVITDVHIEISGSGRGTISNKNGVFELPVQSLPVSLKLTHIGYKAKWVDFSKAGSKIINMAAEPYVWPEVSISEAITVVNDGQINIRDYEFYDPYILILGYYTRYNRSSLFLIDKSGDTITRFNIRGKALSVTKDCHDRLLLEYEYEVYELWFADNFLNMELLYDKNEDQVELPCHAIYNGKLVTSLYANNQLLGYATLDPYDSNFSYFKFVDNQDLIYRPESWGIKPSDVYKEDWSFVLDLHNQKLNTSFYHPFIKKPENNTYELEASSCADHQVKNLDYMLNLQYFKNVIDKPVYAPMHLLNGKLYLFNHTQGMIETFNPSLWTMDEVKIAYPLNKKWVKEILIDQVTQKAYVYVLKRGVSFVYDLNLETGSLSLLAKLPKTFVKDIRVQDGFVYFLYKEPSYYDTERKVMKLYKMKI